jgi:hypothetical protein
LVSAASDNISFLSPPRPLNNTLLRPANNTFLRPANNTVLRPENNQSDAFLGVAHQKLACYLYDDLTFFDLRPLMNNKTDYLLNDGLYTYSYNFCKYTTTSCLANSQHNTFAWRGPTKTINSLRNKTGCQSLTSDDSRPQNVVTIDRAN